MGVRERLARRAVRGPHALVVETPGWAESRLAVERVLTARSWKAALSPADADVLLVCGVPGADLGAVVERVWAQLPGPRSRADVVAPGDAAAALDEATAALLDEARQRADAQSRNDPVDADSIPLAEGGADRDGLGLDVLHVPLGPVLPHWPAGLVLRCALQGDVITQAAVDVYGAAPDNAAVDTAAPDSAPADRRQRQALDEEQLRRGVAVRRCDSAGRLLAVAGWNDAAASAWRTRDALATGAVLADCTPAVDRLARRVWRSVSLRWLLRDLGVVPVSTTPESETAASSHDVLDRLRVWIDDAHALVRGDASPGPDRPAERRERTVALLDAMPGLVTGLDLAAARLVVASLDVDTAALTAGREYAHG